MGMGDIGTWGNVDITGRWGLGTWAHGDGAYRSDGHMGIGDRGHGEGAQGVSQVHGDMWASQGRRGGEHGDMGMGHTGMMGTWGWETWGHGT